jgi:hypothetical protein
MKLDDDRAAVAAAERALIGTRRRYREDTRWLHLAIERHRTGYIIGGGLLTGLVLGSLPFVRSTRAAMSLFSLGATLARTPLGSIAFSAVLGKRSPEKSESAA